MALADSDVVKTILGQFKIKVDDLKRQIESEAKRGEKPFEGEIGVSPRVKDALSRAFVASNELSHSYVGPEHFLIGLAEEGEGLAANLLRRYGLTPQALRQQVSKVVGKGAEDGRAEAPTNTPELDKYSRDLTKMARDGKLDPVIGRAQEIETTIEVLARRKKNNPVLIGEPGVGKTAIVEGLAQRMVAGEVPETLRDKRLVELNINAMVAGAKYRGEFEERVQKVLKEVTEHQGELILFIDEVHTIVGAGQGGGEGGLDVANGFKPMMARTEPDRRHHAQRVSEVHREGRRAGASLPAGDGARADGSADHDDPAWPARHLRGAPQGQHDRGCDHRRRRVVGPLHHRALFA